MQPTLTTYSVIGKAHIGGNEHKLTTNSKATALEFLVKLIYIYDDKEIIWKETGP